MTPRSAATTERFRVRTYAGFIVTVGSICGLLAMAFFRDMDTSMAIVSVAGLYLGSKAAKEGSAHWAASKDGSADTNETIHKLNENC